MSEKIRYAFFGIVSSFISSSFAIIQIYTIYLTVNDKIITNYDIEKRNKIFAKF